MSKTVDRNGFIQICIVVKDIALAAEKWAQVFGVEKPEIRKTRLEGGDNYTYRGKPVSCELLVAIIQMNGFVLELHQPVGGDSTFREFMDRHGNGVHHSGFETVGDSGEVIEQRSEI